MRFTVGQGTGNACPPPTSDGVNVCSPSSNASVSSPVDISAGAKITGGVYRFDLWVDHVKTFTVRNSGDMQTSQAMNPGSHLLEFVVQNASGTHITTSRTTNVGGSAPALRPLVQAWWCAVHGQSGREHHLQRASLRQTRQSQHRFELWAGSTKVLTVRDSGTMSSNVTLAPGEPHTVIRGTRHQRNRSPGEDGAHHCLWAVAIDGG